MTLRTRNAEVGSIRQESREADFTCSTAAVDSYREIVRQNWRLERFLRNPVALFGHNSKALPIGQWKNVRVTPGGLVATLKVASAAANPIAENVWRSILEGTLRAVSVGFVPHTVGMERTPDGEEITYLDDNELMEISVVSIPANAEATMRQRAAGQRADDSDEELHALIARRADEVHGAPPIVGVMCGDIVDIVNLKAAGRSSDDVGRVLRMFEGD